ncbi:sigma factor [Fodinicola feengrottensis]|nr:sigma factor [Fodinicola feengrottensis]
MRADDEQDYVDYVTSALPWLRRLAFLLCRDTHRAEDVTQTAITKLFVHWQRAKSAENLDAYVRTMVVRTFLNEQRMAWARVRLVGTPNDIPNVTTSPAPDVETRAVVHTALSRVAPRQRACWCSASSATCRSARWPGSWSVRKATSRVKPRRVSRDSASCLATKPSPCWTSGSGVDHKDEQDGVRLLSSLRDSEPDGPIAVDVRRAVRSGRRQVRVRQAALPIAGAIAVVALVAGVAFAVHQPQTPTPAAHSGSFDVRRQAFHVGSAGGFTPVTYETGRYRQVIQLVPADDQAMPATDATVTLYAAGWYPYRNGQEWSPGGESADSVDGHRARWLAPPMIRSGAVELAWEYAPGAWGFVSLRGPSASRDRAYKVALSVWPGAHDAVPMPAQIKASALGGTQVVGTISPIGTKSWATRVVEVLYGSDDPPMPPNSDTGYVGVGLQQPPDTPAATTQIGGKPAAVTPTRISFTDGSGLFVQVSDAAYLTQIGGAAALVRMAGDATATRELPLARRPVSHPIADYVGDPFVDPFLDSVAAYTEARGTLVAELGVEPGPRLQNLHQVVLTEHTSWPRPRTFSQNGKQEAPTGFLPAGIRNSEQLHSRSALAPIPPVGTGFVRHFGGPVESPTQDRRTTAVPFVPPPRPQWRLQQTLRRLLFLAAMLITCAAAVAATLAATMPRIADTGAPATFPGQLTVPDTNATHSFLTSRRLDGEIQRAEQPALSTEFTERQAKTFAGRYDGMPPP